MPEEVSDQLSSTLSLVVRTGLQAMSNLDLFGRELADQRRLATSRGSHDSYDSTILRSLHRL